MRRAEWSKGRQELHAEMFPPEDKAARQREATARYRKAHADRIEKARTVSNILLRQRRAHDDMKVLAAALAGLLTQDGVKDLCKELRAAAR